MDYDKLIEQSQKDPKGSHPVVPSWAAIVDKKQLKEYATAIETLRTENEKLRTDLARVSAERDAAVSDISSVLAEVEEIRRGYGVDNADADAAFADLCGNYCAKCGNNCYKEAEDYRCKNFEWRGIKEG